MVSLAELEACLNVACNYHHQQCRQLDALIARFITEKQKIESSEFMNRLMSYLTRNYMNCWRYTPNLYRIFDTYTPTDTQMLEWFSSNAPTNGIFPRLVARGYKFSRLLLDQLVDRIQAHNTYIAQQRQAEISTAIHNCPGPFDTDLLDRLCDRFQNGAIGFLIDRGLVSGVALSYALRHNFAQAKGLIASGKVHPCDVDLTWACQNGRADVIILCLDQQLVPTNEAVTALFSLAPVNPPPTRGRGRGRQRRRAYYQGYGRMSNDDINNLFDQMVLNGFRVTREVIKSSITHKVTLRDVHQYGIPLDSDILAHCHITNFFPYTIDVADDIHILRAYCRIGKSLVEVKKVIQKGVKPDQECIRQAIVGGHTGHVEYLINEYGLAPKIELLNVLLGNSWTSLCQKLVDRYQVLDLKKVVIEEPEIEEKADHQEPVNQSPDRLRKKKKKGVAEKPEKKPVEEISVSMLGRRQRKNLVELPKSEQPTEVKKRKELTVEVAKLFDLDPLKKYSFLEFRQACSRYIHAEQLYYGRSIRLTPPMTNMLKLPKKAEIEAGDLDRLVSLFYTFA